MNISQEIIQMVSETNRENVLLIAMSTLSAQNTRLLNEGKTNHFYYDYEEERWDYYCNSQLGPETKAFLSILDKKGKKADRIVILETEDTRNIFEEIGKSAVQFYVDEIRAFATGDNKDEHRVNPSVFVDCEICHVDLDRTDAIVCAVKSILGDCDKYIDLYIDVQGGFRKTSTQINAIVEYLSSLDNMNIVGRYANDYNPKKHDHRISCVDEEYNTYNLVSAMTIFKKYGRGEALKEYFQNRQYTDSFAIRLAETIELAANSIQQCDVDGFDEAIDKLRSLNEIYEAESVSPELQLIFNDITTDYKPLFDARYRYVEQIRWCIKKNFIQQAMTILESKMPDEYVLNGLKYFAAVGDDTESILDILEKIYLNKYSYSKGNQIVVKKDGYKLKNINHYFINYYIFDSKTEPSLDVRYGTNEEAVERNLDKYREIKGKRNETNHANSSINNQKGFLNMMLKKHEEFINKYVGDRSDVDIVAEMNAYLDEWEKLANSVPNTVRENIIDMR